MSLRRLPLSGWHPEKVKAEVRMKGLTLTDLARRNGFSDSYLRSTLIRPLYRGEQIIARFLGVPAKEIWPQRYDARGLPKNRNYETPQPQRRRA
jgi:Ner family transcriptional regulator